MHIAFVTTELSPFVRGGAGVLVGGLRDVLTAAGHRVSVILAADTVVTDSSVTVAGGADDAGWDLPFMATSKAAAEAVAALHEVDPIDLVEVQDFDGLAFWLLTHRGDLGFAETPLTVRFHGPVDLQTDAMGVTTELLEAVAVMERESFAMADGVVVPSSGIGDLVRDRYGVDLERVRIGPPVIPESSGRARWSEGGSDFLVIGRLSEVKGSHDVVRAAVPVLRDHDTFTLTFAGADGWSATADRPMREWLEEQIPDEVASRIRFLGHVERAELDQLIGHCRAVVVPSRFESFHLGAHEARSLGAPVIAPDLPAFRGLLDAEHGAQVYDGSIGGLEDALREATGSSWATRFASRPGPELGDPTAPYLGPMVEPRHRRSQGGLATAAIARLEDAWLTPRRARPPSVGRRILERVPPSVYRAGKRLVPNRIKDRLRSSTDWGSEADRRKWEDRFTEGVENMAARTAAHTDVDVSVVVPCYNQGRFVREALLSVFEQTAETGIEVVIVDDGSDEAETRDLLAGLDLPGLRVIRQDNAGLPAARNTGIRAATGRLVVTLDADDMLAPDYVARLGSALEADPDAAYAHCWAELVGDTHAIWATRPYNPYQLLLSNSVVGCVLLRKDAWGEVGGYDETMRSGNEDWDLWIRLAAAGHGSVQVREPLFRYRKHGVSMSVETEARYEDALADRPTRYPDLYRRERLAALKREWYPLVSLVHEPGAPSVDVGVEDVERIEVIDGDLPAALERVRGKYVALLPGDVELAPRALGDLCLVLEAEDEAGAVHTAGDRPFAVVRTWSLFDPAGPERTIRSTVPGVAGRRLAPGDQPRPEWEVPTEIRGIPVIRQRPEEAGTIPDWAAP